MNDLSRRATQLLDEARAGQPKLDSRRRERVRTAVVMSVAATAATAASSAQAAGPLAGWLTTTAGKLLIGVGAAIVGSGATVGIILARRAAVAPVVVTTPRVAPPVPPRRAAVEPPPVVIVEPQTPPPIVESPPVAEVLPTVTPVVRSRTPPSTPRVPIERAAPVVVAVTAPVDEGAPTPAVPVAPIAARSTSNAVPQPETAKPLRDELTVLRLAMTHHDSGNDVAALASLDEYEARFPTGVMLVEAQVLRVLALCQLGRTADARSVLRRLELATPASPAVQRLKTSCAAQ